MEGSLKLLHVASGDLWAGAEVQTFYLCRELFRQRVDVQVVLFNTGILADRLAAEGIPVTVFDESHLSGFQLLQKFIEYLHFLKPTLIHTHGHKENVLVGFANALTIHAIAVRTAHGANEINEPFWKFHKHFFHWLDRFVGCYLQKAIIAVSDPLADQLKNIFPAKNIVVIENAIDIDYVMQLAQRPSPRKLKSDSINIAIVGRLVPVKRQDLLIQALPLLLGDYPRLQLHIIGDGPLAETLKLMAHRLGLAEKIAFTGALDPVQPVMVQMDLLVMPSDHEGLPMTLLEALALRIPVVAHAVGGILRLTKQGELAYLVEDHSAKGYARAITMALSDVNTKQERVECAAEYVRQHYDISMKYSEYLALYKKLLQQKDAA